MPQNDRHRTRIVPIEFEAHEDFKSLPINDRVSIVLITNGKASIILNQEAVTLAAPCVMLISQYDTIKMIDESRLAAKSFSFNPRFLNSSLTFERLMSSDNAVLKVMNNSTDKPKLMSNYAAVPQRKADDYMELEDEHDRNMLNLFLYRDEYYDGIIDLPAKTYLRLYEWTAIMGTEVYAQSDGYWTCRIRRYLLQSLYLLDDIFMERKKPNTIKREKSPIDILLEYMHVNYSEQITLDKLCRIVHMNRTSLNKRFKEQTGFTAIDYLLRYRLKISCDALSHTNLSLAEIAEAVGFQYDTYFIKQFSAKYGMTPTEYRMKF